MHSIFTSYRRDDSQGEAGRLFDDLTTEFGEDSVFLDIEMKPGEDFRQAIHKGLSSCTAFLCLIGNDWVLDKNSSGQRRLDDPDDFVRTEIATALNRGIRVVPVLVKGATLPKPDQLPDDIKDLAFRQYFELTHARWKSDVKVLIRELRPPNPLLGFLNRLVRDARKSPVVSTAIIILAAFAVIRGLAVEPNSRTLFAGLVIGTLARLFAPGKNPAGFLTTIFLGVFGSFLATGIGRALGWPQPPGYVLSIIGAILLLTAYKIAVKKVSLIKI